MKVIKPHTPQHTRGLIGNTLFVRPFGPVEQGYIGPAHLHRIEHASFVATGRVKVKIWAEGQFENCEPEEVLIVEAPNFLVIPSDKHHQFEALDPGTSWYCIFSQHEAEEEMSRPDLGLSHPMLIYSKRKPT